MQKIIEKRLKPIDDWFLMQEVITDTHPYVLLMRGILKTTGERVVLKCHVMAPFNEHTAAFLKGEMLLHECAMYEHAVRQLEDTGFFVSHVSTERKMWNFEDFLLTGAHDLAEADTALMLWMTRFPFRNIKEFNHGAKILVTKEEGRLDVNDYLQTTTRERLAAFVVQIMTALRFMATKGIVHGDLRWKNIMYPEAKETTFFDLHTGRLSPTCENEFCVRLHRIIKVFDWDNGFFSHMPEYRQKLMYQKYHVNEHTNMNGVYDSVGFLRTLWYYFPEVFVHSDDTQKLEPAFSKYAYRDPADGATLHQISQKGEEGDPEWPEIDRLRTSVAEVMKNVYDRAAKCLLYERGNATRAAFALAVEGDNIAKIRDVLTSPEVVDLDRETLQLFEKVASERQEHGVEQHFYHGALLALRGHFPLGLEHMNLRGKIDHAQQILFEQTMSRAR